MFNLEELNLPKLREVKIHYKYPDGTNIFNYNAKLKIINLPELRKINTTYRLFTSCANLEEVICPKLQELAININNTKLNKLILGNKINKVVYYVRLNNTINIPSIL